MGRKGMAQTVRGIMARQAGSGEVLIHEPVDLGAKEMCPMAFRTGEEIETGRVVGAPYREGLLHIWGQIDHPIHLPFTLVDPDGACRAINRVPCQRTDL